MSVIIRWDPPAFSFSELSDAALSGTALPGTLTLEFDALVNETVSQSASVTTSPVEVGFAISDGVTPAPAVLQIVATITDRKIVGSTAAERLKNGAAEAAKNQLEDLMHNGTILSIETDARTYDQFLLRTLECPRTGMPGVITFTMGFVEVRTVETDTVAAPVAAKRDPQLKPKADAGKTPTVQDSNQTAAASLFDAGKEKAKAVIKAVSGGR